MDARRTCFRHGICAQCILRRMLKGRLQTLHCVTKPRAVVLDARRIFCCGMQRSPYRQSRTRLIRASHDTKHEKWSLEICGRRERPYRQRSRSNCLVRGWSLHLQPIATLSSIELRSALCALCSVLYALRSAFCVLPLVFCHLVLAETQKRPKPCPRLHSLSRFSLREFPVFIMAST